MGSRLAVGGPNLPASAGRGASTGNDLRSDETFVQYPDECIIWDSSISISTMFEKLI